MSAPPSPPDHEDRSRVFDGPARGTVVERLHSIASMAPDRLAVHAADDTLSYEQLLDRATRLCAELVKLGIEPGQLVGLCVRRSASLVVGALGIMLSGAAYVAIDPSYPDDRIAWMLEDSRSVATVCDEASARRIATPRPVVVLGRGGRSDTPGAPAPARRVAPAGTSDAAYVVYTSGSTGLPKGVVVEHGGLSNLIEWHRRAFSLGPDDRCTQIASPGFDAAVWEIWPALTAGASLHVVPDTLRGDPVALRDWLIAKGITVGFLPTAIAETMIQISWPSRAPLRYLLTGGDALSVRPSEGLPFTLVNNYGLSETAVVATSGCVEPHGEGPPSIGTPISGVIAEVVDDHLDPVGPGEAGELVIGGVAVARGYLHRPELTAERFLVGPTGRRYRTGDLVRVRPTGELEFLGRLDDQLSIRGFRVEPGEITTLLGRHPAIAASVVVGVGTSSVERRLVAYVVPATPARPSDDELAGFLGAALPEHLVPSRFVWMDELPLNAHGKVDRDALRAPEDAGHLRPATGGRTPSTTEQHIAGILSELLEAREVGVKENFFLLGGHSMLGAQLIVRLEQLFDVEISLRYLFDHPTVAELAAYVEEALSEVT